MNRNRTWRWKVTFENSSQKELDSFPRFKNKIKSLISFHNKVFSWLIFFNQGQMSSIVLSNHNCKIKTSWIDWLLKWNNYFQMNSNFLEMKEDYNQTLILWLPKEIILFKGWANWHPNMNSMFSQWQKRKMKLRLKTQTIWSSLQQNW